MSLSGYTVWLGEMVITGQFLLLGLLETIYGLCDSYLAVCLSSSKNVGGQVVLALKSRTKKTRSLT